MGQWAVATASMAAGRGTDIKLGLGDWTGGL